MANADDLKRLLEGVKVWNAERKGLPGANLREADLGGANLSGANLSGAKLVGADLAGANLREANLIGPFPAVVSPAAI